VLLIRSTAAAAAAASSSSSSNSTTLFKAAFELFAYSKATSIFIELNDKRFRIKKSLFAKLKHGHDMIMCLFRVTSFNAVSISDPSPVSDLVHISKMFDVNTIMTASDDDDDQQNTASSPNSERSDSASPRHHHHHQLNQIFYLNWWFLVIIALSSLTILIAIVLIMFLRGKNKKFLLQRKTRMNTILRMAKLNLNHQDDLKLPSLDRRRQPIADDDAQVNSDQMDSLVVLQQQQPIYLVNSSSSQQQQQQQIGLYDMRKSMRGAAGSSNHYNMGTYVSPNGTLSRVNMSSLNTVNDNHDMTATVPGSLLQQQQPLLINNNNNNNSHYQLKQQQIQNLNSGRNLSSLIGFHLTQPVAQPNDYCSSGRIGALVNRQIDESCLFDNGSIRSGKQSNRNHYLVPCQTTTNDQYGSSHLKTQQQQQQQENRAFENENENENENETTAAKIYTTTNSTFGRQGGSGGGIQLPVNYELTNNANFDTFTTTPRRKQPVQLNMYYEHQQVQQQPTYFTHQSPPKTPPLPSPPPPPPLPLPLPKLQQTVPTRNPPPVPSQTTTTASISSSSVPFSGDRLLMNNVAGSRKPLTGFSSFI
jgi:hypothetical protein